MRTHKRLIDIINPTQKTVDALMKLIFQVVDVEIAFLIQKLDTLSNEKRSLKTFE